MAFPFMQLLANSLIIGSIYALVASGFSLIYSTNRFMHFAHGVSVAIGGYLVFTFFTLLKLPFWLSAILTIVISGAVGYLVFRFVYVPLKNKNSSTVILLLASTAILIFFENLILLLFGADVKSIKLFAHKEGMKILGASITPLQLTIIVLSFVILIALWLFMNKTRTGRNMRAVADHPELATIMGINARFLMTMAFIIGSMMAGVAGILIGLEQNLTPTMGTMLIIKGFSGAVIGGITSVPASVVGSYLIGIAENFGIWWLPSGWKDAITFTLLFIFLLFRPNGLFGVDQGVRK